MLLNCSQIQSIKIVPLHELTQALELKAKLEEHQVILKWEIAEFLRVSDQTIVRETAHPHTEHHTKAGMLSAAFLQSELLADFSRLAKIWVRDRDRNNGRIKNLKIFFSREAENVFWVVSRFTWRTFGSKKEKAAAAPEVKILLVEFKPGQRFQYLTLVAFPKSN